MQSTVCGLVSSGQLAKDAGEDLDKRLDEAAERLADGDGEAKVHEKLVEFAQQLVNVRKDGKISDSTYLPIARHPGVPPRPDVARLEAIRASASGSAQWGGAWEYPVR
jgi:hypothetical protein